MRGSRPAERRNGGIQDWRFGPPERPLVVRNAEAVLAHLPLFLAGWPFRHLGPAGEAGREPDIAVVEDTGGGFSIVGRGPGAVTARAATELDAANAVAGSLVGAFIAGDPGRIGVHGGAVEIGGRLVVLIGDAFAGKSSVSLHLAMRGFRLFGDDRIALGTPDEARAADGLCLGISPKLRLPVPPDAGPRFTAFVEEFIEVSTEETAYLQLGDHIAAPFGAICPLGALVLLDRHDTPVSAALEPVGGGEAARAVLSCAFAPHLGAQALVAGVGRLVGAIGCYRLSFSSSREAAGLLIDRLNVPPGPGGG